MMTNDRQREFDAVLRADFPSFMEKAFRTLNPGATFRPNWHHQAINHRLQQVRNGEVSRLIINVPPRSLKSLMISVAYVAWALGHQPTLRFVCVSYSSELALKLARDCRAIMQSDWYRRAFPNTVLARSAEQDIETTEGGGRLSTSVGGTLTGRGGAVIIIDDPIKPDDAASATTRENCVEWFRGTLMSRLDDKASGVVILVMQRLHQQDLAGVLLESGGWDQLKLPAIAQQDEDVPIGQGRIHRRKEGRALHPARESLAVLEQMRSTMGSGAFNAQYLQAPVPAEGALVRREWLHYAPTPVPLEGTIVQSWDCASKDGVLNDYSVCVTGLIRGRDIHILDVHRERLRFPDLCRRVQELAHRFRPQVLLIEDAGAGQALIQQLEHAPLPGVPRPTECKPLGSKLVRMDAACHGIERGELFLPPDAPWLAAFEHELLSFPQAAHDDQVDALSQLLNWKTERALPPGIVPGIILRASPWGGAGYGSDTFRPLTGE